MRINQMIVAKRDTKLSGEFARGNVPDNTNKETAG